MDLLPILKGAATWIPGLYKAERGTTGGTVSGRYCYSVWLRHLVMLESCGLPTQYRSIAELGPGDSLGMGIASLLTGTQHVHALDVVRYARTAANQRVLTELAGLLALREPIPDACELPDVHPQLPSYSFPRFLDEARIAAALATERIARIEAVLAGEPSDGLDIRYYVPWQQCWSGSGPGVDLVMSQAVLEHVEDIEGVHRSLAAGLKLGGAASHVIDFRCHKMAGTWDGHLQYGDPLWKIVKGRRPYLLNRRSPSEHLRAMESAGFEILRAARVEAAPTIPRSSLAGRFSSWDEADRSTATMVVIARRIS
jgi:hypothetical protein